jgi:hypothetical protein
MFGKFQEKDYIQVVVVALKDYSISMKSSMKE